MSIYDDLVAEQLSEDALLGRPVHLACVVGHYRHSLCGGKGPKGGAAGCLPDGTAVTCDTCIESDAARWCVLCGVRG